MARICIVVDWSGDTLTDTIKPKGYPMKENLKILVVEDNSMHIEAAKNQLMGYDLTVISSYDEAHLILTEVIDEEKLRQMVATELTGYQVEVVVGKMFHRQSHQFNLTGPDGKKEWDDRIGWHSDHPLYDFVKRAKAACTIAPFDVILTDAMIPKGGYACMSPDGKELADRQGEMPYGPIIALRAIQFGVKRVGILTSGNHHDDPFIFALDELHGFSAGDVKVYCSQGYDLPSAENGVGDKTKNWKALLEKLLA